MHVQILISSTTSLLGHLYVEPSWVSPTKHDSSHKKTTITMSSPTVVENTTTKVAYPSDARYSILCPMSDNDVKRLGKNEWISDTAASFLIFYVQGIYDSVSHFEGLYVLPTHGEHFLIPKIKLWHRLQKSKTVPVNETEEEKTMRMSEEEKTMRMSELKSYS